MEIAEECFQKKGFYPISFSYPDFRIFESMKEKVKDYAHVIPGKKKTYVFRKEAKYLNDYAKSKFGLTHKKGGWDCFRHLEIMSTRCLPLMKDIGKCPKYNMIHYPKNLFQEIVDNEDKIKNDKDLYYEYINKIMIHFKKNLTLTSMIKYILNCVKVTPKKVLFIDDSLPNKPDYMSVFTLIGLKLYFKNNCDVMFPVSYIYKDTRVRTKILYGRGFGYTKLFSKDYKNNKNIEEIKNNIKNKYYNLIIYGSIKQSSIYFNLVLENYSKNKIICISGDDITRRKIIQKYKDKSILFVREINKL